jgi:hypothetical protein
MQNVYFQQDGANPHTARGSSPVPRKGHFTFRRHPVASKVPRFKHLRCFLWGYLKSRAYAHNALTLADLKETIKQEVAAIDREILDRDTAFQQRLESCIQAHGHHLSDIIFH